MVLVILDGLDASGKSTQALKLAQFLRDRGDSVCVRFHPSDDSCLGAATQKFLHLRGKSAHLAAAIFYMLDVLHSVLLRPWRTHDYVIFVRYLMGTAYLPSPLFVVAYDFFASIVPMSDFMFFLDVAPREAHKRILQTRTRREMFEGLAELELIRRRALSLALRRNWTIIDAGKPVESVENEILESLSVGTVSRTAS